MARRKAPQLSIPCDGYVLSTLARPLESIRSTAEERQFTWRLNVKYRHGVSLANPDNLVLSAETSIMKTALT